MRFQELDEYEFEDISSCIVQPFLQLFAEPALADGVGALNAWMRLAMAGPDGWAGDGLEGRAAGKQGCWP